MSNMSDYEINDKDIETVLRYLKIHNPENADRDYAVQLLEAMQNTAHNIVQSGVFTDNELLNAIKSVEEERSN
jgi:threonine synthase